MVCFSLHHTGSFILPHLQSFSRQWITAPEQKGSSGIDKQKLTEVSEMCLCGGKRCNLQRQSPDLRQTETKTKKQLDFKTNWWRKI